MHQRHRGLSLEGVKFMRGILAVAQPLAQKRQSPVKSMKSSVMRLPRVQFSIRGLMIVIAVVAGLLALSPVFALILIVLSIPWATLIGAEWLVYRGHLCCGVFLLARCRADQRLGRRSLRRAEIEFLRAHVRGAGAHRDSDDPRSGVSLDPLVDRRGRKIAAVSRGCPLFGLRSGSAADPDALDSLAASLGVPRRPPGDGSSGRSVAPDQPSALAFPGVWACSGSSPLTSIPPRTATSA